MFNLLLIINKPGTAISSTIIEYYTYEAAEAAVELLRRELYDNSQYSVKFFITHKGERYVG